VEQAARPAVGSRFAAASRGVTNVPLRSDDKRLFRRLP
jgi:hypothetical protein